MPRLAPQSSILVACLMPLFLSTACDNTIEPFADETGVYSIYSYFDLDEPVNAIRVRDLNELPMTDAAAPLDATVTLEQREWGYSEVLEPTVEEIDGHFVHNFHTDVDIEHEATYHVTVERSDGVTASASATMPSEIETYMQPAGEDCLTTITATFEGESKPRRILVEIGYSVRDRMRWRARTAQEAPGNQVQVRFHPDTLLSEFGIESQDDPDEEMYYTPRCIVLDEPRYYIRYTHFGPDWDGHEVPLDPLESQDVENGIGFFGGLQEGEFSVEVDTSKIFQPPTP